MGHFFAASVFRGGDAVTSPMRRRSLCCVRFATAPARYGPEEWCNGSRCPWIRAALPTRAVFDCSWRGGARRYVVPDNSFRKFRDQFEVAPLLNRTGAKS